MKRLAYIVLVSLAVTPAEAAPVAAAVAGVAAWYASIGVVGQLLVQIGIGLALTAASVGLQYLLSGAGDRQAGSQQVAGIDLPERSGLLERRQVYGRQVVSGGIFFQKTVAAPAAAGPNIYVLGFALGDGLMDGLESVIINGVECVIDVLGLPITEPWYSAGTTYLKVSFRSGSTTQAIDPIIANRFPGEDTNFRQLGVATAVIEMNFGTSADHHTQLWGAGGIPDIKFRIRGRTIYDPRNPSHDINTPSTWTWTQNATLIEADWLRHEMGFGIDNSEIDSTSLIESANIDDQWVPTLTGVERRGTINAVVIGSQANDNVLSAMALHNRAIIRRAFGQYTIRADRAANPVATIHQGALVGEFSFQNQTDTRSALNTVTVQFQPYVDFNQAGQIVYQDATLLAADGQEFETTLGLPYCDSPSTAQRLGFATVTENRESRTFTGKFDASALIAAGKGDQLLECGDVVRLWFDNDYSALNGLYSVANLEIGQDFTVLVSLRGTTANIINGWSTALENSYTPGGS